jgi:hypothetical protein
MTGLSIMAPFLNLTLGPPPFSAMNWTRVIGRIAGSAPSGWSLTLGSHHTKATFREPPLRPARALPSSDTDERR